jgi:hypothetical protein
MVHRTVNRTCPVHHRTVWWPTCQKLQRSNPNGWVTWLAHRTISGGAPDCPVRPSTAEFPNGIDFRNLNRATPKDEYPMPIADTLINNASGNRIISFLDGNAEYNQIFMAKDDASKTTFICLGFIGLFEWVVMTFGLKNAGATYQRAMNLIFHELLGNTVEVYIDDIVVKSAKFSSHLADLCKAFDKMRRYGFKMNPCKCAFGVSAGKFLGFVIHEHGIEIDPDRIKSIRNVGPLTCKVEVQKFLGKVNYLRRFISNLAGKIDAFTPILRLKNDAEFAWGTEQQESFDLIKKILVFGSRIKSTTSRSTIPIIHCS